MLMSNNLHTSEIQWDVRFLIVQHLDSLNMWNILTVILPIRTYIDTTTTILTACQIIWHTFILIGSLRSPSLPICILALLTITMLPESTWASPILCLTISYAMSAFISTNNNLKFCSGFNLQTLEGQQLCQS